MAQAVGQELGDCPAGRWTCSRVLTRAIGGFLSVE